jgi:hypothetical protein
MVWKIRSKTAFTFEKGTQRYVTGKFISVNMLNAHEMPAILVKTDRMSSVRVAHNYRNISRAAKQFLLADPYAEQIMISVLRNEFLWPINNIESPIRNYKPMVRILADHTDRHYSLVACNQHPFQLYMYEYLNKRYRKQQDLKNAQEGKGITTFDAAVKMKVEELVEAKLKTMDVENGEALSAEEIGEIHHKAMNEIRDKMNLNVRTRNKRGEIEDYLEVRRPLGAQEASAKH